MSVQVEFVTVVSPETVRIWYPYFASPASPVMFVGENFEDRDAIVKSIIDRCAGRHVRIFSGHDSLLRDLTIAILLREQGFIVKSQSGLATAAGLDKVFQKQILDAIEVPVPRWGIGQGSGSPRMDILRKNRESTQSRGVTWNSLTAGNESDSYWEEYVDGSEYSAVLYRTDEVIIVFPIVWKGRVRPDLLPPWRRLRTVPSGLNPEITKRMLRTSRKIAKALDIWGFAEVEFIVTDQESVLVIDVNPRISGTTRLVAMASGVRAFDETALVRLGRSELPQTNFAVEIPFDGPVSVSEDTIATSRLTCRAPTAAAAKALLSKFASFDSIKGWEWPRGWE